MFVKNGNFKTTSLKSNHFLVFRHLRTHTGEQPYKVNTCYFFAFLRTFSLKTLEFMSNQFLPFSATTAIVLSLSAPICNVTFETFTTKKSHLSARNAIVGKFLKHAV